MRNSSTNTVYWDTITFTWRTWRNRATLNAKRGRLDRRNWRTGCVKREVTAVNGFHAYSFIRYRRSRVYVLKRINCSRIANSRFHIYDFRGFLFVLLVSILIETVWTSNIITSIWRISNNMWAMVAITFDQRLQFNAITKTKKEYDDECVCMIHNWQGRRKFRLYYIIVVNDIID